MGRDARLREGQAGGLMTTIRNCAACEHIQHTSPTQIVWRCKWHCETKGGEKWRCHVLPEEPACTHFKAREVMPVEAAQA